jgi:hypothetical protein
MNVQALSRSSDLRTKVTFHPHGTDEDYWHKVPPPPLPPLLFSLPLTLLYSPS